MASAQCITAICGGISLKRFGYSCQGLEFSMIGKGPNEKLHGGTGEVVNVQNMGCPPQLFDALLGPPGALGLLGLFNGLSINPARFLVLDASDAGASGWPLTFSVIGYRLRGQRSL